MDRQKNKQKKEKPIKNVDKEKTHFSIKDFKAIQESLKIKEILRTVRMNNSVRVPRGSKITTSKHFNDKEFFDDDLNAAEEQRIEPFSATNPVLVPTSSDITESEDIIPNYNYINSEVNDDSVVQKLDIVHENTNEIRNEISKVQEESVEDSEEIERIPEETQDVKAQKDPENKNLPLVKNRDRKLSLDQTMLSRRISQSELDLHSIGKSPLERKSSFFKKKMDSFLKNTTEIFKRQSLSNKVELERCRGSMSVSLQSLNEKTEDLLKNNQEGSITSLQSSSIVGRSNSSLAASQSPAQETRAGSQPALSASQPLGEQSGYNGLNEAYMDDLLNSRAISMSSGLDSATGKRRTKSNRISRMTWAYSETLSNKINRAIQEERSRETQVYTQSNQDNTSIQGGPPAGRRLSYQRAVSGEDPMPFRTHDSTLKKKHLIPEKSEANYELSNQLAEFTQNGLPSLKGFVAANIVDEAFAYLLWAENRANMEEYFDFRTLPPNEEARQTVIKELISTEVDYINSILSIVEVFMAAAHALQDKGKLLDVDTARLFLNIPDVVNASLYFWEKSMYPMIANAVETTVPFNTELMSPGFCRFREFFTPYEKYVSEQTKAIDYLRSLSSNVDFMTYLQWCHAHKKCNRLQLSDLMAKPMQRLTKYSLILRRIIQHTDTEPERTSLIAMESFATNYVLDVNRAIRQREELEKLDALGKSIEAYEIDFKDDDLDSYFRKTAHFDLRTPMLGCLPNHNRSIVHQGDVRFKDHMKELEVRAFLLTDMLLICKKLSKGSNITFKIIRPKYMVDKMIVYPRSAKGGNKDVIKDLICVVLDDMGTSNYGFTLSETTKDSNSQGTLKLWEQKIREAKLSYEFGLWFAKNPSRDLSVEMDSSSDYAVSSNSAKHGVKHSSDDMNIEREARERVAAMLYRNMGASTEFDFSQASMNTDSFDAAGDTSGLTGGETRHNLRHPMQRNSTGGSSRNSRLSSFHQSTSAASHDEPQLGACRYNCRAGSSVEHFIPPLNPDDTMTSITVNVVSESESETVVPCPNIAGPLPTARSLSGNHNTLRVQPQSGVLALVRSLPDLTIDPSPSSRPACGPSHLSASELLYLSHRNELSKKNRLQAHHQNLSPDHRGTSYPPPSPTRASLKRGFAISYSFKNPPLSKMGHVNSQSQMQAETGPSTSQQKKDNEKGAAVSVVVVPESSKSSEKNDKKLKPVNSRNKSGSNSARSLSPVRREDKGD